MAQTKICLNMIVKNESKIICRLLESVLPLIDSYCICDTGSTDDTIEIIERFFEGTDIRGKIVKEPFRDFGYNRTFALEQCHSMENADYILLLDADMILWMDPAIPAHQFKRSLVEDVYHMFQGSHAFYYKNVRIIKNRSGMSYWGVTHEYVKTIPGSTTGDLPKTAIFINDIGDGGSKTEKFERDIRLLSKGLEENPDNDRYTFYLANSYKDAGQLQNAIDTYKKRIAIGCWHEEVWYSYYMMGKCYRDLGDHASAIHAWMEGYNFYKDRVENLYEIVNYYRCRGNNDMAYTFYTLAHQQTHQKTHFDHLFLQKDVYDYKLDYELSIIGYYCNWSKYDTIKASMKVLACPTADEGTLKNVLSNYKFYTTALISKNLYNANVAVLKSINETLVEDNEKSTLVSSTPSLCLRKTQDQNQNQNQDQDQELVVNLRYVNYRIGDQGEYINQDKIETKNVVATFDTSQYPWKKTKEYVLKYDESYDDVYVGLEDVRLFYNEGKMFYNANRGLKHGSMEVEHGSIDTDNTDNVNSTLTKMRNQHNIEKNWVLFADANNQMKMIYKWYPLTLGKIVESVKTPDEKPISNLVPTHEIDTPHFFKYVRGSTNGVKIDNEIWFICHVVSYESRRYYYHLFVVLDSTTFQVKRYSPLFTFEKSPVEYTLGFVYFEDSKRFLIGYSIMDRETKYLTTQKFVLDEMMI
jgi:glycosyltransferase involved in cell wall biosynthesis